MIPGIQTGNGTPHDKCNLHGIVHARANKKDDIFMQRRLNIDKARMALDISKRQAKGGTLIAMWGNPPRRARISYSP